MSSSSRTAVSTTEDKRFGWIVTRPRVESVVLCFIITTVCMLLLLPVIVYHLPAGAQQSGVSLIKSLMSACMPDDVTVVAMAYMHLLPLQAVLLQYMT